MVTIDFAFGTCTFKKYPKLSRVYSSCPLSLQLSWQESTRKSRNSTAYLWSCGKCCLPMLSMAFLGFPNTCTILTNTYQYIFSFLGPLSQRDPTLPSKALLKPLTGIWNHSQCILGIKKWSAWKVTYLLYIFSFTLLYLPIKRSDIQNFHLLLDICLTQNSQAWWRRCDILRRHG